VIWRAASGAALCAGLAACVQQSDGSSTAAGAMAFRANCAGCHGEEGQGGVYPGASPLTGLSAAHGGVFPAEHVVGILDGHDRNPDFSEAMPEFDGQGMGAGPVVAFPGLAHPVAARTAGLLAYLASIQE
jgi:mono/diheme cytochrome c family protein